LTIYILFPLDGCSSDGIEDVAVECGEGGDSCCQTGSKKADYSLEDIKPHLCYSCRIVADKMSVYPGKAHVKRDIFAHDFEIKIY